MRVTDVMLHDRMGQLSPDVNRHTAMGDVMPRGA